MQTGWLKIGDEWFWFDGSGVMAEDEVVLILHWWMYHHQSIPQ